jgi:hypothetical protein
MSEKPPEDLNARLVRAPGLDPDAVAATGPRLRGRRRPAGAGHAGRRRSGDAALMGRVGPTGSSNRLAASGFPEEGHGP